MNDSESCYDENNKGSEHNNRDSRFPPGGKLPPEVSTNKQNCNYLRNAHIWEAATVMGSPSAKVGICIPRSMELLGRRQSDAFSPDHSITTEFCRNTSLHGLKYLGQRRVHLVEKIFWSIAFTAALIIAGWMISAVWQKYRRSPVIVSFQPFETKTSEIPFPGITICNMNKILKSKAESFMRNAKGPASVRQVQEARENVVFMDHVCAATASFSKRFNFSTTRGNVPDSLLNQITMNTKPDTDTLDMARFLELSSQKCQDMVPLCIWQEETVNCSELFTYEGTDFGKCCTFNMMPKQLLYRNGTILILVESPFREILGDGSNSSDELKDWKNWAWDGDSLLTPREEIKGEFPRRQKLPGKTFGLSILLNPDLHEYFCTTSDSVGFRLLAHSPIEVPRVVDFGNAIGPNSEVFINVKPAITVADEKIATLKLSQRQCYFSDEFNLTFYEYYTSTNCLMECLANLTYEKCFCASYYMPRDTIRKLCSRSQYRCATDIKKEMVHRGYNKVCKQCLPTCTEIRYMTEITSVPLQNSADLWENGVVQRPKWARSNVSIVHIYFGDESTTARLRTELYGFTDLFANFGGLMGLCLGFSGLSLIEIIYYLTIRAFCRKRILSQDQERLTQESRSWENSVAPQGEQFRF